MSWRRAQISRPESGNYSQLPVSSTLILTVPEVFDMGLLLRVSEMVNFHNNTLIGGTHRVRLSSRVVAV